ncbi:MAG TPA: hypothetical protein VNA12_10190 [Mycobacteriales bacterium]|nr:hypothetical protein [Mycobacteriales bacterium]
MSHDRAHDRAHDRGHDREPERGLLIDCGTCTVRGDACGDCVVTVMLGCPPGPLELDADERRALEVLGRSGLVPRLQLAPPDRGAVAS